MSSILAKPSYISTVKLMSLSFSLVSEIPNSGTEGEFNLMNFWKRSLVRSVAGRSLAKFLGSRLGDEAFLCGLLSHFGRMILARVIPEVYGEVLAEGNGWPSLQQEERMLGFTNTDVCATLLKQWNVPELIYMATGYSSNPNDLPDDVSDDIRDLVQLQHVSALVETVLCSDEKGPALKQLHEVLGQAKSLGPTEIDAFMIGLEGGISETAELFSLKMPGAKSHEEIMNEAKLQMVNVSLGTAMDLRQSNIERDQLATEKKTLITKATTDKLTDLPNRALFDEFLEKHVKDRIGCRRPLALGMVMIDIDHFKNFNDTYGHAAGDEVLRRVGETLKAVTRSGDLSARYGGEEFVVVAPQTNPFNLKILANRVRKAIEECEVVFEGKTFQVTASLGAACITEFKNLEEAEDLVKLADSHLYKAKEAGRNRVEAYKNFRFPE